MITNRFLTRTTALLSTLLLMILASSPAAAHCDSMNSPVVKDAQVALAKGEIDVVMKWLSEDDKAEIRAALKMALAVRDESEAAKNVADQYFFVTLVRIHQATEGEGFIGLKSAESVDPAIVIADRALENGNVDQLADKTAATVQEGIRQRFTDVYDKHDVVEQSVKQGRQYVQAYVEFTHFIEGTAHLVFADPSHKHLEAVAETQPTDAVC